MNGCLVDFFHLQGDVERDRGMEISAMMDRHNANIEKSQVTIINISRNFLRLLL